MKHSPYDNCFPISVSAFEEEPVKPLREPLDLEQADLYPEPVEKDQLVVAFQQEHHRIDD